MVPARRPVLSLLPPGNIKLRFFVPEAELPKLALGDAVTVHLRRLRGRSHGQGHFIATHGRIHAAGDLQPRGARTSWCS